MKNADKLFIYSPGHFKIEKGSNQSIQNAFKFFFCFFFKEKKGLWCFFLSPNEERLTRKIWVIIFTNIYIYIYMIQLLYISVATAFFIISHITSRWMLVSVYRIFLYKYMKFHLWTTNTFCSGFRKTQGLLQFLIQII